jgi:DHA1 family bicyclomycin/chloramphenicol resistance-like MFS transporter
LLKIPFFLPAILAALSALGPFSIDTYLPGFAAIGAEFAATPVEVQYTLTAYLTPFALMALWHGALADSFGRKRIILINLACFSFASLCCTLATSIEWLWWGRALQGISAGAGMVVGRAMVRDLLQGAAAQRMMAQVALMFAIAPAIAPIIGGWLCEWSGWRASFIFLAGLTLILLGVCWRFLPETLAPQQRQPFQPASLWQRYTQVLSHPIFLAKTLAISLNFGGFFIYVLAAPIFLVNHLGVSERGFAWLFVPAVAGMMTGSWLSGHFAERWSPAKCLKIGHGMMVLMCAINVGFHASFPAALPWSILPIAGYNIGMALAMPVLTLQSLDLFPHTRGLAASCQSFLQTSASAILASVLVPRLWDQPLYLAFGQLGLLSLSALLQFGLLRTTR